MASNSAGIQTVHLSTSVTWSTDRRRVCSKPGCQPGRSTSITKQRMAEPSASKKQRSAISLIALRLCTAQKKSNNSSLGSGVRKSMHQLQRAESGLLGTRNQSLSIRRWGYFRSQHLTICRFHAKIIRSVFLVFHF